MKNKTQISKELRTLGCKFTQTNFDENMKHAVIEFTHNHVTLYADDTTEKLATLYKTKTKKANTGQPKEAIPDLASIKRMLEAICKDLKIAVH